MKQDIFTSSTTLTELNVLSICFVLHDKALCFLTKAQSVKLSFPQFFLITSLLINYSEIKYILT